MEYSGSGTPVLGFVHVGLADVHLKTYDALSEWCERGDEKWQGLLQTRRDKAVEKYQACLKDLSKDPRAVVRLYAEECEQHVGREALRAHVAAFAPGPHQAQHIRDCSAEDFAYILSAVTVVHAHVPPELRDHADVQLARYLEALAPTPQPVTLETLGVGLAAVTRTLGHMQGESRRLHEAVRELQRDVAGLSVDSLLKRFSTPVQLVAKIETLTSKVVALEESVSAYRLAVDLTRQVKDPMGSNLHLGRPKRSNATVAVTVAEEDKEKE